MDLHPLDTAHLTCVRGGGCCHAQVIPVTPWEIAVLARSLGLRPAVARERCTTAAGTRLRNDGPTDTAGRRACTLLGADGCRVHPDRPLACRLFPLGRSLAEGRQVYHLPEEHRCAALCPSMLGRPQRRVWEWLEEQRVAPGEAAHDAYGRLVCGLLAQAGRLLDDDGADRLHALVGSDPSHLAAQLSRPWFELATAPGLMELVDDPATFVLAHTERLLGAVSAGFAGEAAEASGTLATIALLLGHPLGIPPQAAVEHALAARAAA